MSDSEISSQVLKPSPDPWIKRTIESEIRYLQDRLEVIKTAELEKSGPEPWSWIDVATEKPGPFPWKLIGTISSYVPENRLEQIVARGLKFEIMYIQESIAIRKMIRDELNPRPESPKRPV